MPENKIDILTSRLKNLSNYITANKLLFGLMILISIVLVAVIFANIFHAVFYLPVWFRLSFGILLLISVLAVVSWFIFKPLITRYPVDRLALIVEQKFPHLKNRMIAALQLEKKLLDNRENYSPALIRQCIDQAEKLSNEIDFKQSHSTTYLKSGFRYLGITAIIIMALVILTPSLFSSTLNVYSHPLIEIPKELTYALEVTPKSTDILKFDNIEINSFTYGSKLPRKVKIFWKTANEWRNNELELVKRIDNLPDFLAGILSEVEDTSVYKYEFKEIRHDFDYYVDAGDIQSPVYSVKVVDKPRINNVKVTCFYPRYTGLAPVVIDENDGTVQALKGSRIKIETELNKVVESGKIIFEDNRENELIIDKQHAEAEFKVMKDGTYHLEVTDNLGYTNPDPIEYRIYCLEDKHPQIRIVKPGGNIDLNDYLAFDLGTMISDDFGFSRLVLHYRVHLSEFEILEDSTEFKFDTKKADQLIEYYWDLSNLGLYPGSYVDYYMEVFDNDKISGPKSAVSRTYTARHPTLDEMFSDIEKSRDEMISDMIEAYRQEQKLAETVKELREEMQFERDLEWETQKDIEQVQQEQEKLLNQLEEMSDQFDQLNEQARQQDLLTLEMIQKLNELQKLFDEVATPEMKEAMRKLAEAMKDMDKNELEKAMKEFEMSTEEMIQNMDRAIAQLKKFQIDQKMQAMIAMVEKILENQQQINDQTSQSESEELPKLKHSEDQNAKDMDGLKEHSQELRELLNENGLSEDESADKFCKGVEQSDAKEDMQNMSTSLKNGNQQSAMQSGKKAEAKVNDLLTLMQNAQAEFNNMMSAEALAQMREAIDDILYLSENQEGLYNEISLLSQRSPVLSEYAEDQQIIASEAERLRNELLEIAKSSEFIRSALDKFMKNTTQSMQNCIESLSNNSGSTARKHQTESIYNLNKSAQALLESMNNQSQCNSSCQNSSGMFNKMKKLCQGQNKVNQNTQSMCNNPSNKAGKPSPESLRRLAGQQGKIQQGIAEMVDEFGDRKDVAGRLDNLEEEIRKVVEALEKGEVGPQVMESQKNIHSRMLDFQLSLEKRDYSDKRRADTGRDVVRKSPEELDFNNKLLESAYRAKLEQFLSEDYPPEYESLIKDYFKALIQSQNR